MIAEADLIQALKLVEDISTALHTTSWVWGGLTVDLYQGHLLRDHHDLDYLTLALHQLMEPIARSFQERGWQTRQLIYGDLQIEKGEVDIHLGNISLSKGARWTHNGDLGSLYFPPGCLRHDLTRFHDADVHVVAAEFQYVLLAHPELLNQKWIHRSKDIAAKACLKELLESKGINLADLETLIHV